MSNKHLSNIAIGKFIREKRTESGYSQEELADKLNISKTAVSNWENGNAIVDVKLLVPLSNIFSVQIDDILFPESRDLTEYNYSEYSALFQKVASFQEPDPLICKKMLDMYVDCKIKLLKQVRDYKEAPTDENWQAIVQTNKFGFSLNHYNVLERIDIELYDQALNTVEDDLETVWGPVFLRNTGIEDIDSLLAKIPHLFDDDDVKNAGMIRTKAMLNLIFFMGGERIFRKYVSTFSKKYRDDLFKENAVSCNREISSFTKDETKALKALWREGAELWENGRNSTCRSRCGKISNRNACRIGWKCGIQDRPRTLQKEHHRSEFAYNK